MAAASASDLWNRHVVFENGVRVDQCAINVAATQNGQRIIALGAM